jgi:hypothetical protein
MVLYLLAIISQCCVVPGMPEVQGLAGAVAQANDGRDVLAVAEEAGVQEGAAAQALQ